MSERCRREMIGLVVLVAVGCGAEEDAFELRASEIVGGTAVAADTAGYGVVINADALGSGMFLAPGWVITAGHVLADWDDVGRWTFSSPPSAAVEFGTTFDKSQGTPFVHPNWWGALGAPPPPVGNRESRVRRRPHPPEQRARRQRVSEQALQPALQRLGGGDVPLLRLRRHEPERQRRGRRDATDLRLRHDGLRDPSGLGTAPPDLAELGGHDHRRGRPGRAAPVSRRLRGALHERGPIALRHPGTHLELPRLS